MEGGEKRKVSVSNLEMGELSQIAAYCVRPIYSNTGQGMQGAKVCRNYMGQSNIEQVIATR